MVTMDNYSNSHRHRSHTRTDRKDDAETDYINNQLAYPPYPLSGPSYNLPPIEVLYHPRAESEYSVESIKREFLPSVISSYDQCQNDLPYPEENDYKSQKSSYINPKDQDECKSTFSPEEVKSHRRTLTQSEIIMSALGGAVLIVGGKELWHRRKVNKRSVSYKKPRPLTKGINTPTTDHKGSEAQKKHTRKTKDSKARVSHLHQEKDGYHSDDKGISKPSKSKGRRKSILEDFLDLAGLSNTPMNSLSIEKDGNKKRSDDSISHRSRRKSPDVTTQLQEAARAALIAGATEAFRVRNEPGGWGGEKGKRVLTAAIGASAIDAAANKEGKIHILEAVIGGLVGNNLINGGRNQDENRSKSGRSRSKSRSRDGTRDKIGPLIALASAGLGALAENKHHTQSRSRSRSRSRSCRKSNKSRGGSPDSYLSRNQSPSFSSRHQEDRSKRKRSKSVTEIVRDKLSALGISDLSDFENNRHSSQFRRSHLNESDDSETPRNSRRTKSSKDHLRSNGSLYDPRNERTSSGIMYTRSKGERASSRHKNSHRHRHLSERSRKIIDSDDSLGFSTSDEEQVKKTKVRY